MSAIIHFIILLTCYGAIECKRFRSDYTYHSDIGGWLKLHVIPATWFDAQRWCFMEGAVLASPANANMQTALRLEVKNLTTECSGIHTGVHSIFSKGYFYSIEGVPLTKMALQWLPGQPDNVDNNENCIAYVNGKVADINCSEVLPFVCYKKMTSDMSIMPCGTIDKEYEYTANSCYKFHSTQLSWFKAFQFCLAEGGYLAIINSVVEARILKELYRRHFPNGDESVTFIGFHDWNNNGVWGTIHVAWIVVPTKLQGCEMSKSMSRTVSIYPPSGSFSRYWIEISTLINNYRGQTLKEAGYANWETNWGQELIEQSKNSTLKGCCGAMSPNAQLGIFWCDQSAKFICEKDPENLLDK